jgi:1-deoxy-D-xylulose-5-phosphate reductoisomerase
MKKIVVLGSTGSIGRQTLDVVRAFPHEFRVVGLSGGTNLRLLMEQIQEFNPRHVCCIAPPESLPNGVCFTPLEEMAGLDEVDLVMVATTGAVGLEPTLNALRHRKSVALSNKEPIVMAGHIIKEYERRHGGKVLPVDSEPSAIWQCLQGEKGPVQRLIITASGGPFRNTPLEELARVTPAQALNHPTWQMGKKITIDSATMMNKAFEVIESHWLFNVPWDRIEVVVHPQSTIHSMVEFADGSVKAQMGPPNMRLPIQYALFYPHRLPNHNIPRLPTNSAYSLDFQPLDVDRYPCFSLALAAARRGGTFPAVLSAADEVAVAAFLEGRIGFTDIHRVVEQVLSQHQPQPGNTLEDLLEADQWATRCASAVVKSLSSR